MADKHQAEPFVRYATTSEGEVMIKVDATSTSFTVRDRQGNISQVTSDQNGLTSLVDGAQKILPQEIEKRLAQGVKELGQCLRAKGNLSPNDYTTAALIAFNAASVTDKVRCRL